MSVELSVKDLLAVGAHFGHQTSRWNPKMKPYIFTQRGGIHIIDLQKTVVRVKEACKFITDVVALGGSVLFVGTKKQAQTIVQAEAQRAGQYYVVNRWLGGMLTNFNTIKKSVDHLDKLNSIKDKEEEFTKKEIIGFEREIKKLEANLGGVKEMKRLPGVLVLIDPRMERIAKLEANKLNIPIVAVCDTNCDPDDIDYLIPANDDAMRSIELLTKAFADACVEGAGRREKAVREQPQKGEKVEAKQSISKVKEVKVGARGKAYTAKKPGEPEDVSAAEVDQYASAKAEKPEENKE